MKLKNNNRGSYDSGPRRRKGLSAADAPSDVGAIRLHSFHFVLSRHRDIDSKWLAGCPESGPPRLK